VRTLRFDSFVLDEGMLPQGGHVVDAVPRGMYVVDLFPPLPTGKVRHHHRDLVLPCIVLEVRQNLYARQLVGSRRMHGTCYSVTMEKLEKSSILAHRSCGATPPSTLTILHSVDWSRAKCDGKAALSGCWVSMK
jgi:hypothetical protein